MYSITVFTIVLLCSGIFAEKLTGELSATMGMKFDRANHVVTGVTHELKVTTDDGREVPLEHGTDLRYAQMVQPSPQK